MKTPAVNARVKALIEKRDPFGGVLVRAGAIGEVVAPTYHSWLDKTNNRPPSGAVVRFDRAPGFPNFVPLDNEEMVEVTE